jgi:hypothetical protein
MTFQHGVWIVFENHSRDEVIGAKDAPYFTRLASRCAAPRSYYGITHPSVPNYLAMTSGSTWGVASSVWPNVFRVNAPSIFDEVNGDWREYAGDMPSPCFLATTSNYVSLVNPAVYYTREQANCATMHGSTKYCRRSCEVRNTQPDRLRSLLHLTRTTTRTSRCRHSSLPQASRQAQHRPRASIITQCF